MTEMIVISVDTIMGPKNLAVPSNLSTDSKAAVAAWSRLLNATQDHRAERSSRTQKALIAFGAIEALSLVLADADGMAPFYWQAAARHAIDNGWELG